MIDSLYIAWKYIAFNKIKTATLQPVFMSRLRSLACPAICLATTELQPIFSIFLLKNNAVLLRSPKTAGALMFFMIPIRQRLPNR